METREMAIHSRVLQTERAMAIKLLHSMVPPRIADDLSKGNDVPPEMFNFATVYFSDIEGFTKFASVKTPIEVFTMLNRLFRIMDYCVTRFPRELYKIETYVR
jgi:class 3 adenylate cyclase